jgi:hypothetical protein
MRRTKGGWSPDDLDRLYRGFGFEVREGSKHRIYSHPRYPQLRATVSRSSPLATGYVATAPDLLDQLDSLRQQAAEVKQ